MVNASYKLDAKLKLDILFSKLWSRNYNGRHFKTLALSVVSQDFYLRTRINSSVRTGLILFCCLPVWFCCVDLLAVSTSTCTLTICAPQCLLLLYAPVQHRVVYIRLRAALRKLTLPQGLWTVTLSASLIV